MSASRIDKLSWRVTMAAVRIGERAARSRPRSTAALVEAGIRAESLGRGILDTVARQARSRVHHWESGTGPPATAGPIVLLNGWTASGAVWPRELLTALERNHLVVRIDNRGSGRSITAPAPFTIADLARDAHHVIRSLHLHRPTVVGLSMGGMIAQELALRWPDDVSRLVLMSTRPPAPLDTPAQPHVTRALFRPKPSGVRAADYLRELWSGITAPGFADTHPELLDEVVASVLQAPTPMTGVLNQARAIAGWRGAHRLARLRTPTTVVHGDKDALLPVDNGRRLARAIPQAHYIELAGVGHLSPYEALNQVTEIILAASEESAEHVPDPVVRQRYARAVGENQAHAERYAGQVDVRRLLSRFRPVAQRFLVATYATDPDRVKELDELLAEHGVAKNWAATVRAAVRRKGRE